MRQLTEVPRPGRARHAARAAIRAAERGMSLLEVLAVVAIMAIIASGVAVFVLPQLEKTKIKTAEGGARTVRSAVTTWWLGGNTGCPTISQLVQDRQLDKAGTTEDPWGKPFTILCEGQDVTVTSPGSDGKSGTEDDISIPRSGGPSAP